MSVTIDTTPAGLRKRVMGFTPPDRKNKPNFRPHGAEEYVDFGRISWVDPYRPQSCPECSQLATYFMNNEVVDDLTTSLPVPEKDNPLYYPGGGVIRGPVQVSGGAARLHWTSAVATHIIECPAGCMGVEALSFEAALAEWNAIDRHGAAAALLPHGSYPVAHPGWSLVGKEEVILGR